MTPSVPHNLNPIQWQQALDVSRQACAKIFRDGGSPREALASFGVMAEKAGLTWEKAVDAIAAELCAHPVARAA
jgi:hypothetical protein